MSTQWIDITQRQSKDLFTDLKAEVYPKDRSGFPAATHIDYPPTNSWASYIRNKPISAIPTGFVNTQIDFNINPPGFSKRLILNLNVTNTGGAAINILPHFLIQRYEVMDSNQSVLSTHYADNIYLLKIFQGYEESKRLALAEGISIATYNSDTPLAAGATREFFLHIPSFLDATEQNLNSLNDKVLMRFYFQGIGTDTPASLQLNSCDIITHGLILEPSHLNHETAKRKHNVWKYRHLEPLRASAQTVSNVAANSVYDIKLTSGTGYSAFLIFLLRPSALTYANQNVYQVVNRIELLDQNANIIGISNDSLFMNTVMSEHFRGDILAVKPNIYTISFSIDPEKARHSYQNGMMKLTGNETLRIYSEGTITPGSFTFSIYSYEYQMLDQINGALTAHRF